MGRSAGGASGEDGVVWRAQLVGGDYADVDAGAELGAFGAHLGERTQVPFSS